MPRYLSIIALGIFFASNIVFPGSALAQTAQEVSNAFDFSNVKAAMATGAAAPGSIVATQYANEGFLRDQVLTQRWTTAGILLLAVASLMIVLVFLSRRNGTAGDIVHGSGLVVIVYGTVLLSIVVEDSQQLTASMGILGAIAGYLFGTIQKKETGTP
jgi:hypothetical protein